MELYERHAHLYTNETLRGLISIQNLQNNKQYLIPSENLASDITSIRFKLDLGTYEQEELQEDYEAIGLELFSIDVALIAKEDNDLELLKQEYIEQLKKNGIILY